MRKRYKRSHRLVRRMLYKESTRMLSTVTLALPYMKRRGQKIKPKSFVCLPLSYSFPFWLPSACVDYRALLFTIHVMTVMIRPISLKTRLCFLTKPDSFFFIGNQHNFLPNSIIILSQYFVRFLSPMQQLLNCAACYQRHWQLATAPAM